jgi:hypothetical protein
MSSVTPLVNKKLIIVYINHINHIAIFSEMLSKMVD